MPLGLVVIYCVAAVLWYELLRSAISSRVARRRNDEARASASRSSEDAELEASEREAAEREAAEDSEPDLPRRLYFLARRSAKAERDLAVQTAEAARERAVERIEGRYREIAAELDDEEAERLGRLAERASRRGLR